MLAHAAVLSLLLTAQSPSSSAPSLEMRIADELRAGFVPLAKAGERVSGDAQLGALFTELRTLGDPVCAMLHQQAPVDDAVALRFATKSEWARQKDVCRGCKSHVKAGCWNFFEMNDQHPEDDFALVRALAPAAAGYDCYAVGMVQPYMMHNVLGCASLTVVDFDWRIHDAHFQLLQRYRAGAIKDDVSLDQALADVAVGWVAQSAKPRATHAAAGVDAFCDKPQRAACREHLVRFASTSQSLPVRLELSALHEMQLASPAPTASPVKVLFLSNAIEDIYTTEPEFKRMMRALDAALTEGQRAILIHHVGGYRAFGLYEVTRKRAAGALSVSTLCKDAYRSTALNKEKDSTYETYLDALSVSAKAKQAPPSCRALLTKLTTKARGE